MQARWGCHGDHPIIVLAPSSVQEVYDLAITAFNMSEKYMVPVVLLYDEVVGHLREGVELVASSQVINREFPTVTPENYRPYATGNGLIPRLAPFGSGYRYHMSGLSHDETGFPTGNPETIENLVVRLNDKIEKNRKDIIKYKTIDVEDAEVILLAYGSPLRSAQQVQKQARARGEKVGLIQLFTLWPFPHELLTDVYAKTKADFIIPELSLGQLADEVSKSVPRDKITRVNRNDGALITPAQLEQVLKGVM